MGLYRKFYFKFKILSYKFYRYRLYAPKIYTHRKNAVLRYCLKLPPIHVVMHKYRSPNGRDLKFQRCCRISEQALCFRRRKKRTVFSCRTRGLLVALANTHFKNFICGIFCANAQLTLALYFAQISPRRNINPV